MNAPQHLATNLQRFLTHVSFDGSGCWLWDGSKTEGYGRMGKYLAHRFSYELFKKEIPKGLQVDHVCGVRACVNPEHLDAVTAQENTARYWAKQKFATQ